MIVSRETINLASPSDVISAFWLERQYNAEKINSFVNHPSIYPHVRGKHEGRLDLSRAINESSPNVAFCADYGGVIFNKLMPGLYDMHTAVLPEGRGPIMIEGSRQAFYIMFTKTDCVEILTHCPDGNVPAKAGARAVGFRYDWTVNKAYARNGQMVDSDVYSIKVHDWALASPFVEPIGRWFHERLKQEFQRISREVEPHSFDRNHDKIVGAAVAMIFGGQVGKGVALYNRWAVMSQHPPVAVVSVAPLVIDIHDVKVQVVGNDFKVISCQ